MQANQTTVIWTVVIAAAIMLVVGFWGVSSINKNLQLATAELPTEEGIANAVLAGVVIPTVPTAAEIAALIQVPEANPTDWSVEGALEAESENLIREEMDDNDFKEELAKLLDLHPGIDIDEHDIGEYDFRDFDHDVDVDGESNTVKVEFKVDFENYGDETETARVIVWFSLTELDFSDDFEDAEISDGYQWKVVRFYGDLA